MLDYISQRLLAHFSAKRLGLWFQSIFDTLKKVVRRRDGGGGVVVTLIVEAVMFLCGGYGGGGRCYYGGGVATAVLVASVSIDACHDGGTCLSF